MPKHLTLHPSEYRGVWVYIEQEDGRAAHVGWELLTPARRIAQALGVELGVVIIGGAGTRLATEAFAYGADVAYVMDGPAFTRYRGETHCGALAHLIERCRPEILLFGETVNGRELASIVAAEMHTGLVTDCLRLDVDVEARLLEMTRRTYGGRVWATTVCDRHRPQLATVRPRVMPLPPRTPGRMGRLIREVYSVKEAEIATKWLSDLPAAHGEEIHLADADVIVAVGRGIGSARHLRPIEELAAALGGVIACSGAVIDLGWLPRAHLVGLTGATVRPRLYVAIGISGAPQHLAGIQHADTLVAINRDPDAPIFSRATHGIIGDLFEVVPEMTRQLLAF
jgi:electron transfer flavoprotein alpha subunit